MDDRQFEIALADRRKFLLNKVNEIQRELNAVQEQLAAVKTLLKGPQFPISGNGNSEVALRVEAVGPVEAITSIFRNNHTRAWNPSELRDELQKLKEQGKLHSESDNLLGSAHTVLKSFGKRKIIERAGKRNGKSAYRLTMKWRESLHKEENPVTGESGNGIFTSSVGAAR